MIYFITGITGTVVPVITEELMKKDKNPFFYFAIRKDSRGTDIQTRFDAVVASLDLTTAMKTKLAANSRLVEIDIEKEKMGIDPAMYAELVENTEKILHGAADVRFDQPYEKIRVSNVVFTLKMHELYAQIRQHRNDSGKSAPTMYYISTSYAYGAYKGLVPEDFPDFHPAKPDNTYARTKAEAKQFVLEQIKKTNDSVVIFEPTIIGGSSITGKTRTYNLFYVFLMLGYKGKLPFLTAPDNTLDIVPVDWVAAVISDIMAKDEFHQGVLRLASGPNAISNRIMRDVGRGYYVEHDPDPDHFVPPVRFVPRWFFYLMLFIQKRYYKGMYLATRKRKYRKMVRGIHILEDYIPYMAGYKAFDNTRSLALIEQYTDCSAAPVLQDIVLENGKIRKGYFEKILADTLRTGFGGMVKIRQAAKEAPAISETQPMFAASKH